ncbi:zinc finger protein GLIS3-like isoform X2 [Ornithodoros turicata]|uniref:zinc finger protein GLIS3-like isoform X2 n=1 Tax=Ornithodoros turicata TaxID=34597 RepID=UPI0031399BE9
MAASGTTVLKHHFGNQDLRPPASRDLQRPRAKLTRSKAITTMHLDFLPSSDCDSEGECSGVASATNYFCDPNNYFAPSSFSDGSPCGLSSPGEQHAGSNCLQTFPEDLFRLPLSARDIERRPTDDYERDLSVLGIYLQQQDLQREDYASSTISSTQRPVEEDSPLAELFAADEQNRLAMAPDVGSSCSDLSALTGSSPTLSNFASNRSSARSSFTSRGCRRKRSLSISPSSSDGFDINTIIRSSPTSLVAYLSGSRCSSSSSISSCPGAYGHLSARPSSIGSPRSGTMGHKLSSVYSPTFLKSLADCAAVDSNTVTLEAIREVEQVAMREDITDFFDTHGNLAVVEQPQVKQEELFQAEEELEEDRLLTALDLPKLPPSYDQHMARKTCFQKTHSSDSQPSNYSSFESTSSADGVGELAEVDSTTPESTRSYDCQWIDCKGLFTDQDSLVRHIEKCHIDQRVGDDYTCFWQGCPRRHKPFNARYKLLIHMRVHSGEKPNRCTFEGCTKAFSRLENLKIHLRSHTGERPYSCQFPGCPKAFSNSSDRAKHQRTHQDTKPYACQVPGCSKRYTDPSSLRKHYKNHTAKDDSARKKIRSENESEAVAINDCLDVPPASRGDRPKLEHADSGIGRSPGGSSVNESCYAGPGYPYTHLSTSDNELSCQSSPSTPYDPISGAADDMLQPGHPIPQLRRSPSANCARSPTQSFILEVPCSDTMSLHSFGSSPSPMDREGQVSEVQIDGDLEPLMTLSMSDLMMLNGLGDSISSREDSADEAVPHAEHEQATNNYKPLPPFDAFYASLDDLTHFGGVS